MTWITSFTIFVIVFGSAVRATDSGMGCPDWPLCNDKLVPYLLDVQVFFEWFHRLIAGSLGIMFLVALVIVFRDRVLRQLFGPQLAIGGVLLAVQIVLGGLTVLKMLNPKIVSLHLVNATLFYGLLIWMTVKARVYVSAPKPPVSPQLRYVSWAFLAIVYVQIIFGGIVSSHYAGLACMDFPSCHGTWWPESSYAQFHMIHRGFAIVVLVMSVVAWAVARNAAGPGSLRRMFALMPLVILVQAGLGIINIVWQLPDWASVSHLAVAQLLFTCSLIAASVTYMYGRSFASPVVHRATKRQPLGNAVPDPG